MQFNAIQRSFISKFSILSTLYTTFCHDESEPDISRTIAQDQIPTLLVPSIIQPPLVLSQS